MSPTPSGRPPELLELRHVVGDVPVLDQQAVLQDYKSKFANSIRFPVAGIPMYSALCVPVQTHAHGNHVALGQDLADSQWQSGNASRYSPTPARQPASPRGKSAAASGMWKS